MTTRSIRDVASSEMVADTASLRARDASFRGDFDRYVLGHIPLLARLVVLVGFAMLAAMTRKRTVPWTNDQLVDEWRRRLDLT